MTSTKSFWFWSRRQVDAIVKALNWCENGIWNEKNDDDKPDESIRKNFRFIRYNIVENESGSKIVFGIFQYRERKTKAKMKAIFAQNLGISKCNIRNLRKPLLFHHLKMRLICEEIKLGERLKNWKVLQKENGYGIFELGGGRVSFDTTLATYWGAWTYVNEEDDDEDLWRDNINKMNRRLYYVRQLCEQNDIVKLMYKEI